MCEKTKYAAVLLELGMSRLCHVVSKLQLLYISQVLWVIGGTSVDDMLVAEHDIMGEKSTLSLADQLAVKYGMNADKMLTIGTVYSDDEKGSECEQGEKKPVSYTHLTLPTICRV